MSSIPIYSNNRVPTKFRRYDYAIVVGNEDNINGAIFMSAVTLEGFFSISIEKVKNAKLEYHTQQVQFDP